MTGKDLGWLLVGLLINDAVVYFASVAVNKFKAKLTTEKAEDEGIDVSGVDWETVQGSLETNYLTEKEISKMSLNEAWLLNEWLSNHIEKKRKESNNE